jgi:putative transposase
MGSQRKRHRQHTHTAKKNPETLAARPDQVWSWNISKLIGQVSGVYCDHLYVTIEIFSRWVVSVRNDNRRLPDV